MIGDGKSKDKIPKKLTLEQRLRLALNDALENLNKLMGIRDEVLAAGKKLDDEFKDVLDFAAETVCAITKHPLIAAKFKSVEDEETPTVGKALTAATPSMVG